MSSSSPTAHPFNTSNDQDSSMNASLDAYLDNSNKDLPENDDVEQRSDNGSEPIDGLPDPKPNNNKAANSIKFYDLCDRFERLNDLRKQVSTGAKAPVSLENRLKFLFKPWTRKLQELQDEGNSLEGLSPYNFVRLVIPRIDTARKAYNMKEKKIAGYYAEVMKLGKRDRLRLEKFEDPVYASKEDMGDFGAAVMSIMKDRRKDTGSEATLGIINTELDILQTIKDGKALSNNDKSKKKKDKKKKKKKRKNADNSEKTKETQYLDWFKNVIDNLSPLENKWLVKIILHDLSIGLGDTILRFLHPDAERLYDSNRSLRHLCAAISDKDWMERHRNYRDQRLEQVGNETYRNYLSHSKDLATLGNMIAPMKASRTSFAKALTDMCEGRRDFQRKLPDGIRGLNSLHMYHPAFICEVKLDGERAIVHYEKGVVKIQTRNGYWSSCDYSPIVGPALRKALSRFDVNVILDCEIIPWDQAEDKPIPMMYTTAVAKARREWMLSQGLLEDIDMNLHANEKNTDYHVNHRINHETRSKAPIDAAHCTLKLVVFDLMYIDGPGCAALDLGSPNMGSIVHRELWFRKFLLYKILEVQEKEVDHVDALIVRPDGTTKSPSDYFELTENGFPFFYADTVCYSLEKDHDQDGLNILVRDGRSDNDIEVSRALALERFYKKIVEVNRQEGIVLKELETNYHFGEPSKAIWRKFKPDYEQQACASDLDVVIVGGYYQTGKALAGMISTFLLAIKETCEEDSKLLTFGTVNGGSMRTTDLERLLRDTGYDTETFFLGKWFRSVVDGEIPPFISATSFQRDSSGDRLGWRYNKKEYPDVWIHPKDSVVVTINAAELMASNAMSAGLAPRFARITNRREDKNANDIQTYVELRRLYDQHREEVKSQSFVDESEEGSGVMDIPKLFLTTNQRKLVAGLKRKRPKKNIEIVSDTVSATKKKQSTTLLCGKSFYIIQAGGYSLDKNKFHDEIIRKVKWVSEADTVGAAEDVSSFIKSHGGRVTNQAAQANYIIGGKENDGAVGCFMRGLDEGKGILDWTYIYRSIFYALEHKMEDIGPLIPRPYDYLYCTTCLQNKHAVQFDAHGDETDCIEVSITDFTAELEYFRRNKNARQVAAVDSSHVSSSHHGLADSMNSSELEFLYTSCRSKFKLSTMVIYVLWEQRKGERDVTDNPEYRISFYNNANAALRDDELFCALQQVKIMGALVVKNINEDGLTHVMVPRDYLKNDSTTCAFLTSIMEQKQEVYSSELVKTAKLLSSQSMATKKDVMFITPEWVNKHFEQATNKECKH